jgi:hypothetical protein
MEMQTPDDSSGLMFVVTDLLRGVRYIVADKGSHYEIEVPRESGCAKIVVSQKADVIAVAEELIRLLDNADQTCFAPYASAKSLASRDSSGSTRVVHTTTQILVAP